MSRFRARFGVYLATSSVLLIFIAFEAVGQDSPRGEQKAAGDQGSAADKTGGSSQASGKDATGTDQDAAGKAMAEPGTLKDVSQGNGDSKSMRTGKSKAKAEPEFVQKTDAEWRKILTRTQYMITRQKATEPAFSGKYATGHFRGTFLCICCEAEVFSAANKFDSGTGWPSFDRPANARAVGRAMDYSALEPRVEVMCRRCGAHLGHIFDDGPTITGLRFCINSAAIKLRPLEGETDTARAPRRTASRTKSTKMTKSSAKTKTKSKAAGAAKDSQETHGAVESDRAGGGDTSGDAQKPSQDQGP
jgi:peptide-methionine (R)-S-oxide reductase